MTKLITFALILFSSIILLSNRGGRNEPNTAAPGESGQTCNGCHSGGNFTPSIRITLKDQAGSAVTAIRPNTSYKVEVKISSTNPAPTYGFQMVPLIKGSNVMAGDFTSFGTNVRNLNRLNREYLLQSAPRADGTFTADWLSPTTIADSIIFYASGLAANGTGNDNGDKSVTSKFIFGPDNTSSSEDLSSSKKLLKASIITDELLFTEEYNTIEVLSTNGSLITKAVKTSQVDVSRLQTGVYFARVTTDKGVVVQRFFKF